MYVIIYELCVLHSHMGLYPYVIGVATCLANAMGVPIEKIHISDIDDIYSRARNIRSELPCEMEFAGIHFTLVDKAA